MDDDLLAYYNAELAHLRDAGAEFAAKYPKVAGRLMIEAGKCADPHVERLLEGFAFLTARIRRKIDDEFPEITDALTGMLYPHYQRPLPSSTIVQLQLGSPMSPPGGVVVPVGSRMVSRSVGGLRCQFRSAYPVTLWPLEVESARLDPDRVNVAGKPPEAVALLRLGIRALGGATFSTLAVDRLRFYLDGEGPTVHALHEMLLNDACQVLVRGEVEGRPFSTSLPADSIRPVGFGPDEGLLPYPHRAFVGYRLLQEYFALPEKFLFVDIDLDGLGRRSGKGIGGSIEVLIFFRRPPRSELSVQPENFRLGCTPAVNLFPQVCEPIALNQIASEYRVVPDVHHQDEAEVFSIDEVTSSSAYLEEPTRYEPFYAHRHATEGAEHRAYWFGRRRPSVRRGDPGTEVDLAFVDLGFRPTRPAVEMVTVRATCTNRDLPARLPFGGDQGDFEVEGQAAIGRARCLRKPTEPLRPPLGRDAQWRLISHLSLNHLSLIDSEQGLDALREVLRVYDFADSAVTRQQIAGITRVASRRVAGRPGRSIGNAVCLGMEITVEFDETSYVGTGVFPLACVLDRFFGLYASINAFSQLVATTRQREGILKRWPPRAGERTLL